MTVTEKLWLELYETERTKNADLKGKLKVATSALDIYAHKGRWVEKRKIYGGSFFQSKGLLADHGYLLAQKALEIINGVSSNGI